MTIDYFDVFGDRYIDIGAGGPDSFDFTLSANVTWLAFSNPTGTISPSSDGTPEHRVLVSVSDWDQIPVEETAAITVTSSASATSATILFTARNTQKVLQSGYEGSTRSLTLKCFPSSK